MSVAEEAAGALWVAFVIVWQLLAFWTAKAVTPSRASAGIFWVLCYNVGFVLLFVRFWRPVLPFDGWPPPLWINPPVLAWGLVAIQIGLFAFAFWARRHLGLLWSGILTLREGHRVVDTGPYRLVRHPIYTGFIGASWTMALIGAEAERLLGAVVLTVAMISKAKVEEALLRRELGEGDYDAYAKRTPMIVPFSPI